MLNRHFLTAQAADIIGMSRRTLAEWDEKGFLGPSVRATDGRGTSRVYSFRDLVAARAARALRRQGVSFQRLRKVVDNLKNLGFDDQPLASVVLILRGDDVHVVTADQVMSVLSQPGQIALTATVDLAAEVAHVKRGIERLEAAV